MRKFSQEHKDKLSIIKQQPILQYSKDNILIKEYNSLQQAAKENNISINAISNCLRGESKTAGKFIWVKKNKPEDNQISIKNHSLVSIINIKDSYDFFDIIISKKDLLKLDKEELETLLEPLIELFRTVQVEFPYPLTKECLPDIFCKISKKENVYNQRTKTFNNTSSSIGNSYLKSKFKNFWHSKYKNSYSPVEYYFNDKALRRVIKYRLGINETRETFDICLHQIVRGIGSAMRGIISFFKPSIAAAIYKEFLKDKETPSVIDPCAGFGGRLLGFASVYPKGTYIGIEPNPQTYKYLCELKEEIQAALPTIQIELYNCKLEDYKGDKNCDLTFTSIPYWDVESYAGNENILDYKSFEDWVDRFITKGLLTYDNLLINLPENLQQQLKLEYKEEYLLKNTTSHFNKKQNEKFELILFI